MQRFYIFGYRALIFLRPGLEAFGRDTGTRDSPTALTVSSQKFAWVGMEISRYSSSILLCKILANLCILLLRKHAKKHFEVHFFEIDFFF